MHRCCLFVCFYSHAKALLTVLSPVGLPSGDMFDLHQAAQPCLTGPLPRSAGMRVAWWSVPVSDVASARPEAAAGEESSARWPLFTSSQWLPVFLRAKSCLKLPPLSSYRLLASFWFGLAENDSQHSKRETQSQISLS